ncbi:unnamed protein product, partial [Rotaria sp. Silwood2]
QKSEQTQASTTVSSSVAIDDVNVEMQEDLDPFEMLESVNILDRLAKDFFDKIVMLNNQFIDYFKNFS